MPRLSGQKGEGKRREPAMKVWNHLVWQDLGEFGATLASDAQWGCSLGDRRSARRAKRAQNNGLCVQQHQMGGMRGNWGNVRYGWCGAVLWLPTGGVPRCYWSAECTYGYAHSLYRLALVVTTVIWRARRMCVPGGGGIKSLGAIRRRPRGPLA